MISTGLRKFMRALPRPYELAADVFQIYRQYKDVLHIVEQGRRRRRWTAGSWI